MSTVEGFVAKVFVKNGKTAKGRPWTAYSLKLEDSNGNEMPDWFGCGFDRPTTADGTEIQEGDFVRFEVTEENGRKNVTKDADGKAVIQRKKNPPARAGGNSGSGNGKGGGAKQTSIHYQNSRTAAVELVGTLLKADALPVTQGKNKGDRVKRYDEVLGFVDKLTVQFFLDLEARDDEGNFRLLATVADGRAGEVDETDLPVDVDPAPDAEEAPAESDSSGDDFE